MIIQTINPANELVLHEYTTLDKKNTIKVIEDGHQAFLKWRRTDFAIRSQLMQTLAALLQHKKEHFSKLITSEMGKPISQSLAEIEKCVWVCKHYAEHSKAYLESKLISTEMAKTLVCYQPLGLIFIIMPWNFPFWQVLRCAAPTIMAGNAMILKHAPVCAGTGVAIAELFLEAGFPAHLFQQVILSNDMAANVIAHEHVAALSFTGSEVTGRHVASVAALHLKKSVLELGGNDPYLVLADADIELAAESIVQSRMNNCGQVCIAAKRILVHESIFHLLTNKIIELISGYIMGDPFASATRMGPMARADLRKKLHQQVTDSIHKGALLKAGGKIPEGRGYYYPPTLLVDVTAGMPAFDEELFGPVIAITAFKNNNEAIALANQSRYGLAAAVFTRDVAIGEQIATYELETGACFVNAMVASDPRLPFGGIKFSGFGRELAREGILEFVNVKTIAIK